MPDRTNDQATHYGASLRHLWSLEQDATFLNHGAFGATPIQLTELQNQWRARLESHPSWFFMSELPNHILHASQCLAGFVDAPAEQTVMVENATSGIGAVLSSLNFKAGERIITTSHVYNAVRNILRHVRSSTAVDVTEVELPVPIHHVGDLTDAVVGAIDDRTRLLVIDHIASPSAIVFPVRELVAASHARGVPVLVDGSHAPGMIDLSITDIGAEWYVGNCHKWLCAPKGAAFLVAAAGAEQGIHPSVISHAYGMGFKAEFGKIGTRDPSAWLCVPAAIEFHQQLGGAALRQRNQTVAAAAAQSLVDQFGTEPAAPLAQFGAMVSVRLPGNLAATPGNAATLRERLWIDHRIDALVLPLSGSLWLRVSMHAYNDQSDVQRLGAKMLKVLDKLGTSS